MRKCNINTWSTECNQSGVYCEYIVQLDSPEGPLSVKQSVKLSHFDKISNKVKKKTLQESAFLSRRIPASLEQTRDDKHVISHVCLY